MHGFSIGRNVICIHKIFSIIQQLYKEELCARFWVKGFKVKVHQDKSSLYLKRARSLVLTNSWPQEAGDILGLGGIIGIWAAQALPLEAAFPPLHSCWKAGQLAMVSRESELWIYMYNLLILMSETNFFSPKKRLGMKSPQRCAGISLQSLQIFVSGLELGVQWGQRGI